MKFKQTRLTANRPRGDVVIKAKLPLARGFTDEQRAAIATAVEQGRVKRIIKQELPGE